MQIVKRCVMLLVLLLISFSLFPYLAQSGQSETEVICDEANEPLPMNYGDHTTGCSITPATDLDTFTFIGTAGDTVRIIVDGNSNYFDPRLEIRDPNGAVIEDTYCTDSGYPYYNPCSFAVEITLVLSGTYYLALSDLGTNETGYYTLQLEKISPAYNPSPIAYNSPVSDTISPTTDMDFFAFEGVAGSDIRINVDGNTNYFDPRLEIWAPDGTKIEDTYCADSGYPYYNPCSFTVDESLALSGTYVLAISDKGFNETGNYEINLQCIFGPCPTDPPDGHPICDMQLNGSSFVDGDTVVATVFRIANPGSVAIPVEFAIWMEAPGLFPIRILKIGSNEEGTTQSMNLPPGHEQDDGPLDLFIIDPTFPRGDYVIGLRMVDPVTQKLQTFDLNHFTILP